MWTASRQRDPMSIWTRKSRPAGRWCEPSRNSSTTREVDDEDETDRGSGLRRHGGGQGDDQGSPDPCGESSGRGGAAHRRDATGSEVVELARRLPVRGEVSHMERYNPAAAHHVVQVGKADGRLVWAVRVDLDERDNAAAVDWLIH